MHNFISMPTRNDNSLQRDYELFLLKATVFQLLLRFFIFTVIPALC